jgi:hypothetical protein
MQISPNYTGDLSGNMDQPLKSGSGNGTSPLSESSTSGNGWSTLAMTLVCLYLSDLLEKTRGYTVGASTCIDNFFLTHAIAASMDVHWSGAQSPW